MENNMNISTLLSQLSDYIPSDTVFPREGIQFIFNSKPLPTSDLESQYTQYIIELRKANVYSLTDFVSRQYDDITYQSDIIT